MSLSLLVGSSEVMDMGKAIRFLRGWRGRRPGEVNRELEEGVMGTLVACGYAEWVEPEAAEQSPEVVRELPRRGRRPLAQA
jgi:hypothetical protein